MYEAHFGLKSRPFGAKAQGAGVFVGPQQAKIMTSLKQGLVASDAIITVTGPVGVGKTTIVSRALESISPGRMVAWVGRMQLAPDEVLELLLAGFGVSRQAKGTIRRFAAFRRLLNERAAAGAPVAIVVEDAMRIGNDALAELEALTAADTGDASSANIILMGPPELNKLLTTPELARIHQRNRLRQTIDQLSATEVHAYLKHCIREAGGDYDAIFDDGVTDILIRCSGGIPRIINTLCETALTTAAGNNAKRVSLALMRQVAADAFGFEPDLVATDAPVDAPQVQNAVQADHTTTAVNPEAAVESEIPIPLPEVVVESVKSPNVTPAVAAELSAKATPPTDAPKAPTNDIPELINDTNVELTQLETESEDAVAGTEFDIDSTQTQKRPAALASDDPEDSEEDEPDFSLDQALSPETDQTNVMPGITPNLDQLAAAAKQQDRQKAEADIKIAAEAVHTPTENLPTLSNSMRVDVEAEVKRAENADAALAAKSAAKAAPVAKPIIAATPESAPQPEPKPEQAAEAAVVPQPAPEPEPPVQEETAPAPQVTNEKRPEPAPEHIAKTAAAVKPTPEPEPVVAEKTAPAPEAANDPEPEPEIKAQTVAIPEAKPEAPVELSLESEPAPADKTAAATDTPARNKPARRTPNIDALEAALNSAKKGDFSAQPANEPVAALKIETAAPIPDPVVETEKTPIAEIQAIEIPEITLDDSLPKQKRSDQELEKCAAEIGGANSLEDISDFAAETIFGNEAFDEIAAAVTANPPIETPSPVMLQTSDITAAANETIDVKPPAETNLKDMDASAKSRLAMVNALNNEIPANPTPAGETIELGEARPKAAARPAKPNGPQPEPIENQINTSMTQTLKALSAAKATQPSVIEDDEKPSGGLFSRFRRSS